VAFGCACHARILLLADQGHDDEDIADALALSARTVGRVLTIEDCRTTSCRPVIL
jgi:hypothetical protein